MLMLFFCTTLLAQNVTVTGTVTDDQGQPAIGATVKVSGQSGGTVTDMDGQFTLNCAPNATVEVNYIGYEPQQITLNGRRTLEVTLKTASTNLNEVVVVGFGTQRKVNLTGSVATVGAKDIAARPVNNVIDALQGIVPGMNISTGSNGGQLNSTKKFNIRGSGTIGAGSSVVPLVLIDGMDGDLSTINPQDIDNISVLKDASASSIYGSRAAGGVILVTTKKGKAGRTQVNYNNSFRFNSPLNMPEMANSYEFALYFNTAGHQAMFTDEKLEQIKDRLNGGTGPTMFANDNGRWEVWDRTDLLPVGNTDWLKTWFGNSSSQEHNLSVNGGNDRFQYYFSGNILSQNGMLKMADDTQKRYRLTGRITTKITDWMTFGYTTRFVRTDYKQPVAMNPLFYHNMMRYWPIIPLKDPNGYYTEPSNAANLLDGGVYRNQRDEQSHQFSLNIEPIKNWVVNVEMNYRTSNTFNHQDWLTAYSYDVKGNPYTSFNNTSSVYEYAYKDNYFNPNVYTSYQMDFGDHHIKPMVGFQSEWLRYRSFNAQRDGVMANIPTLNTTTTNPRVGGGLAEWSTAGFFGRVNYEYKDRYLVEASVRYDGSSRFTQDKRWKWFPSFSLGWNVARESFFEPIQDKLSTLKFRFSWGKLGNQNTDNWYPFYSTMGYSANGGNWLVNGEKPNISSQPALVSALLTWEKTRSWNLGLDVGAFNNRLTASFDYFQRKTYDMVGPAPELPDVLGTAVPKVNNLDMTSRGWELQVAWRDRIQDFSYGVTLNLSDSRVKIDKYPNEARNIGQTYYEGAYLGDIWGYETIGIAKTDEEMQAHLANANQDALGANWAAGDIMYRDLNGDKKINTGENTVDNPGDRKIIGNSTPRYNFGLNLDAQWKGFDLKIFFQGTLKRDYWAGGNVFWGANGGKWQSIAFKEHMDYFRNDPNDPLGVNLDAYYPRPDWGTGKNQNVQTRYLQNAAYARLKNLTLGYTLPKDLSHRFYVDALRVFVSAENLFTITSFTKLSDPELIDASNTWGFGKTYPLSKTFSFGVSVTF